MSERESRFLRAAIFVIMVLSLYTGWYIGRHAEVICDDEVRFVPHPTAYAGQFAICDGVPVTILD